MSLELKALKDLLEIQTEPLLWPRWPNEHRYQSTATCRKAQCRHCTITFNHKKELSLSAIADELVGPFSLLCVALAKVAKEENGITGKRKAKYVVSKHFDDFDTVDRS